MFIQLSNEIIILLWGIINFLDNFSVLSSESYQFPSGSEYNTEREERQIYPRIIFIFYQINWQFQFGKKGEHIMSFYYLCMY